MRRLIEIPADSRKAMIEAAADFHAQHKFINNQYEICCAVTLVFEAT